MNKEQLMALGMDEQTAEKAANAFKEELKGYVPKARLDEVIAERDAAKESEGKLSGQLEELKKSAGDNEALKGQIEKLQEENRTAAEKHAAELKALKLDNAVSVALTEAKALNMKAVRALLELENAEFAEDGRIKGLDKQIEKLKAAEDSKMLFGAAVPPMKGAKLGEGGDRHPAGGDTGKMSYDQLCAYLEANPDVQLS